MTTSLSVIVDPKIGGPLKYPQFVYAHTPRPTQRFKAYVLNDPGNNGVTWEVAQGGGSIDEMGIFYPPETAGTSTIRAVSVTDKSKSDDATVSYEWPLR